jgi:outer membrane protein assembly factor BamB
MLTGCMGRLPVTEPPKVFPLSTAWVVPLEQAPLEPVVTDGERVFVATRDTSVQAFVPETGSLLWRRHRPVGWLTAAAGLLVVREADGAVSRLDPATGDTRWRVESGIAGSLPAVIDGDRLLIGGAGIAALDAETGRAVWGDTEAQRLTTAPVAVDGFVLTTEPEGRLRCRDRQTGRPLWEVSTGSDLRAPPVVDSRGRILLGTTARSFVSLDLRNRGRTRWRWKVGTDVAFAAALSDGRVLFASFENVLYALSTRNGNLAWRAPLPSRPLGAPLVVEPVVLIPCQEREILGFELETGKRIGGVATPSEMRTAPLVLSQRVFVGLRNPWSLAGLSFASLKAKADEEGEQEKEGKAARPGGRERGPGRSTPGDRQDEPHEDDDEP